MRKYEITYIIRPSVGDEAVPEIAEKYQNQVTEQGGQVVNVSKPNKQKLAYEIDRETEGYYVTMRFDAEAHVAEELCRVLKLADDILRHLLVCVD